MLWLEAGSTSVLNAISAASLPAISLHGPQHQDPEASTALFPLDLAVVYENQEVQIDWWAGHHLFLALASGGELAPGPAPRGAEWWLSSFLGN